MNQHNNNIFSIQRIVNCETCGTHFRQLFKSHELCRQCFHGIKAANATHTAVKELRLSKKYSCGMEAKP